MNPQWELNERRVGGAAHDMNMNMNMGMSMSELPLLFSFRRCPYAIRARLAIAQAGLQVALCEVDLKRKPPALLALSPKATVPVLRLPDGTVLAQSLDIMRWALSRHDPQGWLVSAHPERDAALVQAADGPFKQVLDRYKYLSRHPGETAEACRHAAAEYLLHDLEAALAAAGANSDSPWLSGLAHPCLADAAIVPLVRQFAGVDAAWFAQSPWVATQAWLARWLASPLWGVVMAKVAAPAPTTASAPTPMSTPMSVEAKADAEPEAEAAVAAPGAEAGAHFAATTVVWPARPCADPMAPQAGPLTE